MTTTRTAFRCRPLKVTTATIAIAILLGACSKTKDEGTETSPATAQPRVVLPATAPRLSSILGKPREQVHAELGPPVDQGDNEDDFERSPAKLSVTFGHGVATRFTTAVSGVGVASADIARWLDLGGEETTVINGSRYRVVTTDSENFAWVAVDSAELPRRRPPIAELLAGNERSAARLLKGWEEMLPNNVIDRDDDLTILVNFDEETHPPLVRKGNVRLVQVTFREGVLVDKRRSEILPWLGLEEAEGEVNVSGRRFQVTADKMSLTFQRLYTRK